MSYPWYSLYQRPNHFARQFKLSGYAVDVVEMRYAVRLNSILNKMKFDEHRRDIDRLESVVKVPLIGLENAQLSRIIKRILRSSDRNTEWIFWLQGFDDRIDYDRLLPLLKGIKILDVSDSFPDFFTDLKMRERLMAAERTVAKKVDVVLATAEVLFDKFRTLNPRTYLIKNGVDLSRYTDMKPPSDPDLLKKLEAVERSKTVCYQGSIASWFDFELMDHVIRKNDDLLFLFAGMVDVRVRRDFGRLERNGNLHYIGAVSPDVLPWILSKIDVGIIPFKINDLIRATNPIKLYEYLAAGKPVVATPMIEVMRYEAGGIVATADEPDAFSSRVREMARLSEDTALREERMRIAHENGWQARFQKILENIPELSPVQK